VAGATAAFSVQRSSLLPRSAESTHERTTKSKHFVMYRSDRRSTGVRRCVQASNRQSIRTHYFYYGRSTAVVPGY